MAIENYTNDYSVAVSGSGINGSSTSLTVNSPAPIDGGFRILCQGELMFVSSGGTGTSWTVIRGIEGTAAVGHTAGTAMHIVLTSTAIDNLRTQWSGIGTYANLPSSGMKSGDRYKCTDSKLEMIYNGSSWNTFVMGNLVALPNDSAMSWVNQGTATSDSTSGRCFLTTPNVGGDNLRCRVLSLPSTPYTLEIGFMPLMFPVAYATCGMILRDSSGGKIRSIGVQYQGSGTINLYNWNSATSSAGNVLSSNTSPEGSDLFFFKLYDDGTTRSTYWSNDGQDWIQIHSEANGTWVVPNQYGYMVTGEANGFPAAMSVYHFKQY